MLVWLSLVLCYLAFLALALAMPRHHEQLRGRKPGRGVVWLLRITGAVLLGLSAWPALIWWGNPAVAVSSWLGILSVAAFAVAMMLTYASGWWRTTLAGAGTAAILLLVLPVFLHP